MMPPNPGKGMGQGVNMVSLLSFYLHFQCRKHARNLILCSLRGCALVHVPLYLLLVEPQFRGTNFSQENTCLGVFWRPWTSLVLSCHCSAPLGLYTRGGMGDLEEGGVFTFYAWMWMWNLCSKTSVALHWNSWKQPLTRAVLGFRGFRVSRFVMSCARIGWSCVTCCCVYNFVLTNEVVLG